jgi:oligopeptide/dipeptide ABC transporter ATP-binding protein
MMAKVQTKSPPTADAQLLSVEDLRVEFRTREGIVHALNGVTFGVSAGETLGLVGESACGKSVTALSVVGLLAKPTGHVIGGQILFQGRNLLELSDSAMRNIRGRDIAMVFQNPMSALNPLLPIGLQISEVLEEHQQMSRSEAMERATELLRLVGIPSPEERIRDRPYQMSGGMCQRVMIAAAVACGPSLLLADEPTTALDVTIQAQILELLARLRQELNMGMILISHDLGVVAGVCDRVAVMYAGCIVEAAPVDELFAHPRHPYTLGLLHSIPNPEHSVEELTVIEGAPPDQRFLPPGCAFAPRCVYKRGRCDQQMPGIEMVGPDHYRRCWIDLSEEGRDGDI